MFGQEPQSIHRTPVALFILRTGGQVLCGWWGGREHVQSPAPCSVPPPTRAGALVSPRAMLRRGADGVGALWRPACPAVAAGVREGGPSPVWHSCRL